VPSRFLRLAVAATASLLVHSSRADAQVTSEPGSAVIFPDPSKFASGLFTEGETGAVQFLGPVGDKVGVGPAIGTRVGYDLTRWFAVQLHLLGSTHVTKASGPTEGQLLQSYQGSAEGRLTFRFGRPAVFAEGGIGFVRWSTNLLNTLLGDEVKFRTGFAAGGALGAEYHSLSRHFSVGVRYGALWLKNAANSTDLVSTLYVRYTF
jgi:hypothetical protein